MNIGQRIQTIRKELNMSVDELATRLNKNRATVYRYEKGEIENLPIDILEPLADALQTTPQYLLGLITKEAKEKRPETLNPYAKDWYATFGTIEFTQEEVGKLIEYGKFLLTQRKPEENEE